MADLALVISSLSYLGAAIILGLFSLNFLKKYKSEPTPPRLFLFTYLLFMFLGVLFIALGFLFELYTLNYSVLVISIGLFIASLTGLSSFYIIGMFIHRLRKLCYMIGVLIVVFNFYSLFLSEPLSFIESSIYYPFMQVLSLDTLAVSTLLAGIVFAMSGRRIKNYRYVLFGSGQIISSISIMLAITFEFSGFVTVFRMAVFIGLVIAALSYYIKVKEEF
jgi:hypothetical protein